MDWLRGVAIVLVLISHAVAALDALAGEVPSFLHASDLFLEPFRMPMLMFLSGMLLGQSLTKSPGRFFSGKFRGIAWPYLTWSVLIMAVTGGLTWTTAVLNLGWPQTVLWYLWFLLAYYTIAWFLQRLRVPLLPVLAVALVGAASDIDAYRLSRFCYLFLFFMGGHLAVSHWHVVDPWIRRGWVIAVSGALAFGAAVLSVMGHDVRYSVTYVAGVIGLIVLMVRFAPALGAGPRDVLVTVGRRSLIFYVSHWPAQWVVTALLLRLGVDHGWVLFGAAFVTALGFGVAMMWLSERMTLVGAAFTLPPLMRRSAHKR